MSSSVEEKLRAVKELKENGVKTYVFFGPVLPYLSDQNIEQYFHQIASAGVDYVYVDKLNLKPGLWVNLERFLQKDFPQLHEKWKDILLGKNDYYKKMKVRIGGICKKFALECKFCF
jgi:DNA repair photolyase